MILTLIVLYTMYAIWIKNWTQAKYLGPEMDFKKLKDLDHTQPSPNMHSILQSLFFEEMLLSIFRKKYILNTSSII